ncbi:MAG: hydroxymethylbilane synthase [Pseudomonadota bacterium]|nr:hydroxymethylbilane synthase [Pseudomonadota bacterium]
MKKIIRIATRKSPLALIQANIVKHLLEQTNDFNAVDLIPMSTSGDTATKEVFKARGGKGLFLKELEQSLLNDDADIAVHSLKDVPASLDRRFSLLTITERADPSDVLISKKFKSIDSLPNGALIGTSSPRRIALLKAASNNIKIKEIRGNIQTRIDKLKNEDLDGIILAAAGIHRLSIDSDYSSKLPSDIFIPSAGQGVLCVEYLKKNKQLTNILTKHVDKETQACADAERSFINKIGGDCMSPIGVNANIIENNIMINAVVSDINGENYIKSKYIDKKNNAVLAGEKLAKIFIKQGARKLFKMN